MTPAEFARERPCLEEIAWYKDGLRKQGVSPDTEAMAPLYLWEKELRAGRDVPRPAPFRREFEYRKGRKPKRLPQRPGGG